MQQTQIQAQLNNQGEVLLWDPKDIFTLRTKHRIVGKLVGSLPSFSQQNKFHSSPFLLSDDETTILLHKGLITLYSADLHVPHLSEIQQFEQERRDAFAKQLHNGTAKRKKPEPHDEEQPSTAQQQTSDPSTIIPTKASRYTQVPASWSYPSTPEERRKFRVFSDLYDKGMYISDASKFGGDFLAYSGDPLRFHAQLLVFVVAQDQIIYPLDIIAFSRLGVSVKKWAAYAIVPEESQNDVEYVSFEWQGIT